MPLVLSNRPDIAQHTRNRGIHWRKFGIVYESRSGLVALLHSLGLEYHKPEVIVRNLDAERQQAFIEGYDKLLNSLCPDGAVALTKIGELLEIERAIAGKPPGQRQTARMEKAKPKLLAGWLDTQLQLIPGKSELAGAIRYARPRWEALTAYRADGRLEISNNAAENAIRPLALGRKNCLFACSDAGGERAAIFYALIRTARLNGLEPEAYLRDVLAHIGAHPINAIDALLPWNIAKRATLSAAA